MAASSASMAASKLLNLRNPAVQYLVRRQLLHPSAGAASSSSHLPQPASISATLPDAQSFNLIHPETGSTNHELNARNWGILASNLHQYLQLPSGPCSVPAYRTYAARYTEDDAYEDDDDDDDDEDDDGDIQDYSGSDFGDDYDDDYEDVDEDSDAHPRSRRYRN